MQHSFKILNYDKETKLMRIQIDESLNIERLKTYYSDDLNNVTGDLVLSDPRKFSPKQRALYRALLNDIWNKTGQDTDSIHEVFKEAYKCGFGYLISTKDTADTSIEQMNNLIELVIDFMFEYGIPFRKGYELLPRDESYFYYQCLKHRKCVVCGKPADICHVDTVGAGRNRRKIDHSEHRFYAGCRVHHSEEHTIGTQQFLNKYQIMSIKLDVDTRKKLNIGG